MEEVVIRQYRKDDRDFIRDIAWQTAFMGKPADVFFDDREILADFLTLYFTDYEPWSCFVAEINGKIVGYLIGAKNVVILKNIFLAKIAPRLLLKIIINGTILKKKNMVFMLHCLFSFLKGEFKDPDFSRGYPAVLHLNLKESFRNLGIGSRLIAVCVDYFKKGKISGVQLATMSDHANKFFHKQGFHLLYKGSRSYFNYILHRDIPIYILGKKL
jgi:ribosomal protein S18 acetylase RimI-like enzyme